MSHTVGSRYYRLGSFGYYIIYEYRRSSLGPFYGVVEVAIGHVYTEEEAKKAVG